MADFAIETERLILREWREEDAAPFHAMCNDPAVMTYLGPLQSRDDIAAAIGRQRHWQATKGYCFWAVEQRDSGAMIGFCGLKPGPEGTPLHDRTEIGWRFARDLWGQGLAREAAQASLDWGWANLAADSEAGARIWAMTVLGNSRSWGLMERLGMSRHADLDFDHPALASDDPLRPHITYSIARPQ